MTTILQTIGDWIIDHPVIDATIIFFAVMFWDVLSDHHKFLSRKPVRHTREGWIRAALLVPSGILFTAPVIIGFIWHVLLVGFAVAGMMFFTWWLLFDAAGNALRGYGPFWNGGHTNEEDDSLLDQFCEHVGDFWEAVIKIGGAAAFITLYYIIHLKYL